MKQFFIAAAFLAVCGCTNTQGSAQKSAASDAKETGLPLRVIEPQNIDAGQCGLALWTQNQDRIFYAIDTTGTATIDLRGQVRSMARKTQSGAVVRGFAPQQTYQDGDLDISLALTIETRDGVLSGAVVRKGVLALRESTESATLIIPVVGVIGCQ